MLTTFTMSAANLSTCHFSAAQLQCFQLGQQQSPLLLIDDFYPQPALLLAEADNLLPFTADPTNFYPGVRKNTPAYYQQFLTQVLPELLALLVGSPGGDQLQILQSAFAISTLPVEKLRPIQMLPHFDSVEPLQWAMVHYLCDGSFGGTSFYQHRHTGYERIDASRLVHYSSVLKAQAQAAQLHLKPAYHVGDSPLFRCLQQVPARFNRAILYPANLLHSGDIDASRQHAACPSAARLTVSNFIRLQRAAGAEK